MLHNKFKATDNLIMQHFLFSTPDQVNLYILSKKNKKKHFFGLFFLELGIFFSIGKKTTRFALGMGPNFGPVA